MQLMLQPWRKMAVLFPGPSTLLKGMIRFTMAFISAPFSPGYDRSWKLPAPDRLCSGERPVPDPVFPFQSVLPDNRSLGSHRCRWNRRTDSARSILKAPLMISSTYSGLRCTVISIGKISPVPEVKYRWKCSSTFNWSISSSGSSPIGIRVPGVISMSSAIPTWA